MAGKRDLQDRRAALDAEVGAFEEKISSTREQARLADVAASRAEAELDEVAADEKAYRDAEARARVQRSEQARLERVGGNFERDLEGRRQELERVEFELAHDEAKAKSVALEKAAERLAEALAKAVQEGVAFKKASGGAASSFARARDLCPDAGDLDWPESPTWLPEGTGELLVMIEEEKKERARERATATATEQGRRERAQTARRKLISAFAWSGDSDVLDELRTLELPSLAVEEAVAEARKAHAAVRARCAPAVERLLEQVEQGRKAAERALADLARMSDVPADLRAETEGRLQALAGREAGVAA